MSTVLVRLKPYDRKRGHVLRSYTIYSMRFRERNGWYEVEKEIAELLKSVRQPPIGDRPADSMPFAFDVMSKDDAEVHEEEERKEREERAKAISPYKMTSTKAAQEAGADLSIADLPENQEDDEPEPESDPEPEPAAKPRARRSTRGKK